MFSLAACGNNSSTSGNNTPSSSAAGNSEAANSGNENAMSGTNSSAGNSPDSSSANTGSVAPGLEKYMGTWKSEDGVYTLTVDANSYKLTDSNDKSDTISGNAAMDTDGDLTFGNTIATIDNSGKLTIVGMFATKFVKQ